MRSASGRRHHFGMMKGLGVVWMMVHVYMGVLVEAGRKRVEAPPLENRGTRAWNNFRSEFGSGRGWRSIADRWNEESHLLTHAVSDQSNKDYSKALREFLDNVKRSGLRLKTAEDWDWALVKELDMMCYGERVSYYRGNNLLNGFLHSFPEFRLKIPRARRALKTWGRLTFSQEGQPISRGVIFLLAGNLFKRGRLLEGIVTLLSFDSYLREQDWERLRVGDVNFESDRVDARVALVLGPRSRGETKKTGSDQGVEVEDLFVRRSLYHMCVGRPATELVFPFDQSHFRREWARSRRYEDCLDATGSPHSIRHSRPSEEARDKTRSLEEIRRRGRWRHEKSVARYSKEYCLVRHLASLKPGVRVKSEEILKAPLKYFKSCIQSSDKAKTDLGRALMIALAEAGKARC